MSLDITIKEQKEIRCPDCGKVVAYQDVAAEDSGGSAWYDFLERVGYYVPAEKRTEKDDWYGKDMLLSTEQARQLAVYAARYRVYNYDAVNRLIVKAQMQGNRIAINADW